MENKEFQNCTINWVKSNFERENRLLVADEVGLGKTVVAKSIASEYDHVVYICSNEGLARQNAKRLNDKKNKKEHLNTRLSTICFDLYEKKNQKCLVSMTPQTSFDVRGKGCAWERRRIYKALSLAEKYFSTDEQKKAHTIILSALWMSFVPKTDDFEAVNTYFDNKGFNEIANYVDDICELAKSERSIIQGIRRIFAKINVEILKNSENWLVVLDEFQRYRYLIKSRAEGDFANELANTFFENKKILLLSATPFKMYSTLEEVERDGSLHYSEFMELLDFLGKEDGFESCWNEYIELSKRFFLDDDTNVRNEFVEAKKRVEESLYKKICRTERVALISSKDKLIEEKEIDAQITKNEVKAYLKIYKHFKNTKDMSFPIEYAKSTPYFLSFLDGYLPQKELLKQISRNDKRALAIAKDPLLCLKKSEVCSEAQGKLKPINANNGKLQKLKDEIFESYSPQNYLWVPPSKPYYEPCGPYKGSEGFSKYLVFSGWEMVPRMLSVMLSHEAKLKNEQMNKNQKGRLTKNTKNLNCNHNALSLKYPSAYLLSLKIYQKPNINIKELVNKIKKDLDSCCNSNGITVPKTGREDIRWYHYALVLLDDSLTNKTKKQVEELNDFKKSINYPSGSMWEKPLGKMPQDLYYVMALLGVASFGLCAYRSSKDYEATQKIATSLFNYFNNNLEAMSIVESTTKKNIGVSWIDKKINKKAYWKRVLIYCYCGNIQAMFDEYYHVLKENNEDIKDVFSATAGQQSKRIDIYVYDDVNKKAMQKSRISIGFAIPYASKTGSKSDESVAPEVAFNSPFRPFVLISTSTGQEGLDFHHYCRKVVHWNLPANPIDIEQREGRVSRFKSLSVRQSIAINANKKKWDEIFESERDKGSNGLVPYWTLNDAKYKIESIFFAYPYSKDKINYSRGRKIISLYRLTLGHPAQGEIMEAMLRNEDENDDLAINLCPAKKQ